MHHAVLIDPRGINQARGYDIFVSGPQRLERSESGNNRIVALTDILEAYTIELRLSLNDIVDNGIEAGLVACVVSGLDTHDLCVLAVVDQVAVFICVLYPLVGEGNLQGQTAVFIQIVGGVVGVMHLAGDAVAEHPVHEVAAGDLADEPVDREFLQKFVFNLHGHGDVLVVCVLRVVDVAVFGELGGHNHLLVPFTGCV